MLTWKKMLVSLYAEQEAIKKISLKLGIEMSTYTLDFLNKT